MVVAQALERHAKSCLAAGVELCNWRRDSGLAAMKCPDNSHYEGCASPCPNTCADPAASDE